MQEERYEGGSALGDVQDASMWRVFLAEVQARTVQASEQLICESQLLHLRETRKMHGARSEKGGLHGGVHFASCSVSFLILCLILPDSLPRARKPLRAWLRERGAIGPNSDTRIVSVGEKPQGGGEDGRFSSSHLRTREVKLDSELHTLRHL